jgi:hypothetical protein
MFLAMYQMDQSSSNSRRQTKDRALPPTEKNRPKYHKYRSFHFYFSALLFGLDRQQELLEEVSPLGRLCALEVLHVGLRHGRVAAHGGQELGSEALRKLLSALLHHRLLDRRQVHDELRECIPRR